MAYDSYDDIDWLNKFNRPTYKKIEQFTEKQKQASSWLGKWYWQIRINKLKEKLVHYE